MFKRLKNRLERRAIASAIIFPVALTVVAFLGLSCYLALLKSLSPALSALVTAAAGIVVIAVILLIARLTAGEARQRRPPPRELPEKIEEMLQEHADPYISDWVRNNPDRAAIVTLVLGVAAGYSKSFQRSLLDMYNRYADTEARRRTDRRS